jgi:hypothetical protein
VLFVRNVTWRFECLKSFVMYLVSLPEYVKMAHLRSFSGGRYWGGGGDIWGRALCAWGAGRSCSGECNGQCFVPFVFYFFKVVVV